MATFYRTNTTSLFTCLFVLVSCSLKTASQSWVLMNSQQAFLVALWLDLTEQAFPPSHGELFPSEWVVQGWAGGPPLTRDKGKTSQELRETFSFLLERGPRRKALSPALPFFLGMLSQKNMKSWAVPPCHQEGRSSQDCVWHQGKLPSQCSNFWHLWVKIGLDVSNKYWLYIYHLQPNTLKHSSKTVCLIRSQRAHCGVYADVIRILISKCLSHPWRPGS